MARTEHRPLETTSFAVEGSVERANRDVEDMLMTWRSEHKTRTWSQGLRFVQYMKNRALHAGIKRSPYEAMFGVPARVGLERTGLPTDLCHLLQDENDLEQALEGMYQASDRSDHEEDSEDDIPPSSHVEEVNTRQEAIAAERAAAKEGLVQQAKRMKRNSDAQFPPPAIGTTV